VTIGWAKHRALGTLLPGAARGELDLVAGGKATQLAKAKALRIGWASTQANAILNALGAELQRARLLVVGVVGLRRVVPAVRRMVGVVGKMVGYVCCVPWMSVCTVCHYFYKVLGKRMGRHFRVHRSLRLRSS